MCYLIHRLTSSGGNHCFHSPWLQLIELIQVICWDLSPNISCNFFQSYHNASPAWSLMRWLPFPNSKSCQSELGFKWKLFQHNLQTFYNFPGFLIIKNAQMRAVTIAPATTSNIHFFRHYQKGQVAFNSLSFLNGWSCKNKLGRKWKLFQCGLRRS